MHSAIYRGYLRHRRFRPRPHCFTYPVFMMYLDLDELPEVLQISPWWSDRSWRPARFLRRDFHGDPGLPLAQAIRRRIHAETGEWHEGPIRMLGNLRYFGFNINPICCYYCFDADETLRYIVAEVTNTPWNERQSYVLVCDPEQRIQRIQFQKLLHVSPFNPMNMKYHWCNNNPAGRISLNLASEFDGAVHMDATLALRRREIDRSSLGGILLAYPWMTARVAWAIYWQAFKLWLKRNPVYDHPQIRSGKGRGEANVTSLKTRI